LTCAVFGTLLTRGIPFVRKDVIDCIYNYNNFSTMMELDRCTSRFADHDRVTKTMCNLDAGIPDCIAVFFKDKNPGGFFKLWKTVFPNEKMYTEKELEPYVKKFEETINPGEDIVCDIKTPSAVLTTVVTPRFARFFEFCKRHGKEFMVSTDNMLIGRPMKQWQFGFICDIGQTFFLNPQEFYSLYHFFTGNVHGKEFVLPNMAEIMEKLDIKHVYRDCYPIDKILSVAEYFAKMTGGYTGERLFESPRAPLLGIFSRFPATLIKTTRIPTTGTKYTNDSGEYVVLNGESMYTTDTETKNSYTVFARVAHTFMGLVEDYNNNIQTTCNSVVIRKQIKMSLKT